MATEPQADLALAIPLRGVQLIEASAGTGKTFAVATLYARLVIEGGFEVTQLLAVRRGVRVALAGGQLGCEVEQTVLDLLEDGER